MCPPRVDAGCASLQVNRIEQLIGADLHVPGIGDVAIEICKGQFSSLDLQVQAVRRVRDKGSEIKVLEDTECD